MNRSALIALALLATTTAASAHDYSGARGDRIDDRQSEQAWRIERARQNGELTWLERQKLRFEQGYIRGLERQARRDGYISRDEYRAITEAQNEAGRDIYRQSHDRQIAWWRRVGW